MSNTNFVRTRFAANGTQSSILKVVRDHAPISRSGIAAIIETPLPAVSKTVNQMIENLLITELPLADIRGARRKRGIRLNPSLGCCMSIQYGPSGISGTVMDTAYGVMAEKTVKQDMGRLSQKERIEQIEAFVSEFRRSSLQASCKCLAMALIDPGAIDNRSGSVVMCSIMDDWANVPIAKIFQEKYKIPVLLLNCSIAALRGSDRIDTSGSAKNMIYVEYGDGISCGLKLGGRFISGRANLAGEFGHFRVTDKPVPCRCGSVGCLEAVAAMPALVRNLRESLAQSSNAGGVLSTAEHISGPDVLLAAARGDRLASRIVDGAYEYLGRAVGGLINIINPDVVVFDKMVSVAGEAAVSILTQAVKKSVLPSHLHNLELKISTCGTNLASFGGAVAALDQMLEHQRLAVKFA